MVHHSQIDEILHPPRPLECQHLRSRLRIHAVQRYNFQVQCIVAATLLCHLGLAESLVAIHSVAPVPQRMWAPCQRPLRLLASHIGDAGPRKQIINRVNDGENHIRRQLRPRPRVLDEQCIKIIPRETSSSKPLVQLILGHVINLFVEKKEGFINSSAFIPSSLTPSAKNYHILSSQSP